MWDLPNFWNSSKFFNMVISLTATPQLPDRLAPSRRAVSISHCTKSQPPILRRKNTASGDSSARNGNLLAHFNDLATLNIYFRRATSSYCLVLPARRRFDLLTCYRAFRPSGENVVAVFGGLETGDRS
jgi:hypothetical protein